ncbi:transposable element Tcb2 transposase [Trichonephila clavipes]|nr:transposable element Tcb2 transposase [Trichonephila clavipes]
MIEKDNVMCGTMVIVKEDFTPVCNWLLGRVVEVYHGSDGKGCGSHLKLLEYVVEARGGRVRSTTPAEDRYIVLSAKRNRRTTAQQVANQFLAASGKQISRKTVARRLRGGGLYARRPVVCVPLTRQHRTARFQWCREHHNWTGHAYYSQMRVGSVCHRIVDAN